VSPGILACLAQGRMARLNNRDQALVLLGRRSLVTPATDGGRRQLREHNGQQEGSALALVTRPAVGAEASFVDGPRAGSRLRPSGPGDLKLTFHFCARRAVLNSCDENRSRDAQGRHADIQRSASQRPEAPVMRGREMVEFLEESARNDGYWNLDQRQFRLHCNAESSHILFARRWTVFCADME
jgi:hypothetical protein